MEDAELLYRLQQKGLEIEMSLIMHDYSLPMTMSRNIIGEITGKSKPFEYVAVSGHVDTLDVGQGAMDDAVIILIYNLFCLLLGNIKFVKIKIY